MERLELWVEDGRLVSAYDGDYVRYSEVKELEDKLNAIEKLCDERFISCDIKPYAGANSECLYCGAIRQRDGTIDHSASDCPVIKYQEIKEKHR